MNDEDRESIKERQFFAINKALGKVIDNMGLVSSEVLWHYIRTVADVTADKEIIEKMLAHSAETTRNRKLMETQHGYVEADRWPKAQKISAYIDERNELLLRMILLLCYEKGISVSGAYLSMGSRKNE